METELKAMNEKRTIRGYSIIAKGVTPTAVDNDSWLIPSQSTDVKYLVRNTGVGYTCECQDHFKRKLDCKHIMATKLWLKMKEKIRQEETIEIQEESANRCIYCYSESIIKKDKRQTTTGLKQRYLCKKCNKKFVNDPVKKHKGNGKIVSLVLDLYFKGISLRKIKDHLKQFYNMDIDHSTIYRWVEKFIGIMNGYLNKIEPQTSETWHVDEQMIKVNGNWMWNYNLLDANSRFLIANAVTKERTIPETRQVFKKAKEITTDIPEQIISDGLFAYEKAIKKEYSTWRLPRTKHVRYPSIRDKRTHNNRIERYHNTFRERDKILRGFKKANSPVIDGFRTYYNFIRPHQALNGQTPSQVADINLGISQNDNRWLELLKHSINNTPVEKKIKPVRASRNSLFRYILKIYDKDGNELNPKELGFKDGFNHLAKAEEFIEFYKLFHPDYVYKIEKC
jgi:transposase-like protein